MDQTRLDLPSSATKHTLTHSLTDLPTHSLPASYPQNPTTAGELRRRAAHGPFLAPWPPSHGAVPLYASPPLPSASPPSDQFLPPPPGALPPPAPPPAPRRPGLPPRLRPGAPLLAPPPLHLRPRGVVLTERAALPYAPSDGTRPCRW